MTVRIPEGWYADPQRPGERGAERWWNGASWTAHTRVAPPPEPVVRPSAPRAATQAAAPRPGVPPHAAAQGTHRPAAPPRPLPTRLPDGTVLAELGPRLSAFMLDAVIVLGVSLAVSLVLDLLGRLAGGIDVAVTPVLAVVWFGYHAVLVHRTGQTPGKSITRIRVRDLEPSDSGPGVSWRGALLRPLVTVASAVLPGGLGGPLNIADAVVLATHQQRRALHDLMAGTVVVEVPRPVTPGYVPPGSSPS